jgi:hypothetical chaperone protein
MIRIGIDFGTSNSAAALAGKTAADAARVVEIDLTNEDKRLLRSVLFFPESEKVVLFGAEAINRYIEEGDGRFLQSIKSFLHQSSFEKTSIRGRSTTLEELVAVVLRRIRTRVEEITSDKVERVVLGRPALFSLDPARDKLAHERLTRAAHLAGFESFTFLIEPIAAALGYEESLTHDEIVLVGDFGAGTSDFTLMRLGPSHRHKIDRNQDVIAWTGVRVGGDRFDAKIVEHQLLTHFGANATYESMTQRLPIPHWMTRKLLAWNELSLLREADTLEFLKRALLSSDAPKQLQNLITLAEENLPYHLYRAVEATKRKLSDQPNAQFSFDHADIRITETVSRSDFERWTLPLRQELIEALDRVLAQASGVVPDTIFLTGGTSKIPSVRKIFSDRFGLEKLRQGDAFTSVVAGLGRAAAMEKFS